jgi:hypothetical protein
MNPHSQPRISLVLRHPRRRCVSSGPGDTIRLPFGLYQPTQCGSFLYDPARQRPRTDGNSISTDHHYLLNHIQNP